MQQPAHIILASASPRRRALLTQIGIKAGSYAIQGIAAQFIKNINDSFSGVMGLPLFETAQLLKQCSIRPLDIK